MNKAPYKKLNKTIYELWKAFAPNYLKVSGCLAKVTYLEFRKSNIWPKTFDCGFNSYAKNNVAYKFMCLTGNSICEFKDVEFFEHLFPLNNTTIENFASSRIDMVNESISSEHVNELKRSERKRTYNSFGPDFIIAFIVEKPHKIKEQFVSLFLIGDDPKTYKEALTSIDSSF